MLITFAPDQHQPPQSQAQVNEVLLFSSRLDVPKVDGLLPRGISRALIGKHGTADDDEQDGLMAWLVGQVKIGRSKS